MVQFIRDRSGRSTVVDALLTNDEMTYMHQRLSDALHEMLETSGTLRFAWVLVTAPLATIDRAASSVTVSFTR